MMTRLWYHLLIIAHLTRSQTRARDCSALGDLRSTALLYAHRCNVRDVAVPVPVPSNVIPDLILPSHIVVPRCQGIIYFIYNVCSSGGEMKIAKCILFPFPRCSVYLGFKRFNHLGISGLCLNSLGSSCSPKKTKLESHSVVVYVNSTPYCTSIELEHHRGPCRCECDKTRASCSPRHHFREDTCTWQCLPGLGRDKLQCVNSTRHTWHSDTCQCGCKYKHTCAQPGQFWDGDTCSGQTLDTGIQCNAASRIVLLRIIPILRSK